VPKNFVVMSAKIQKENHFPITIRHWLVRTVAISDGVAYVKLGTLL
jgi:LEA14-like dessication related protein